MNHKTTRYAAARWAALIGIIACGTGGYLFFSPSGGTFVKNGTAIAVQAWHAAFGGASDDDGAQEIGVDGASSSIADLSDDASAGDIASDNLSGDLSDSTPPSPPPKAATPTFAPAPSPAPNSAAQNNAPMPATPVPVPVAAPTPAPECPFPNSVTAPSSQKIIVNEVAWMGSLPHNGASAADAAKNEWLELKNILGSAAALSGWQIENVSQKLKIVFGDGDGTIPAGGFLLLVRGTSTLMQFASGGNAAVPSGVLQKIYSGDLTNTGDMIAVIDPQCGVSDFLDASSGWPAGNNSTKQTMERDASGAGWHTGVSPGGTPGTENSVAVAPPSPAPTPAPVSPPVPQPQAQNYTVFLSVSGSGRGTVTSSPPGIACDGSCSWSFSAGTAVVLYAVPDTASVFGSWSGGCSGAGNQCAISITGPVSVGAAFIAKTTIPPGNVTPTSTAPATGTESATGTTDNGTGTNGAVPVGASVGHLLIAAVQIAGASTTNDFVRLYNPTGAPVDVSGWRLHKKSGTGTDSSIKVFPAASVISPGGYFMWANSAGGFSETIGANVSSTESLAADNSVALMDASGTIIDAVAWGTGTNQYVEGGAYPTDPMANQLLRRILSGSAMVDTNNNASDFMLAE